MKMIHTNLLCVGFEYLKNDGGGYFTSGSKGCLINHLTFINTKIHK
jgi:hypothetical protein